jgi:hypothetical protein
MTRYMQIKLRLKKAHLGVVKCSPWYSVYFLRGIQKGIILTNVASLDILEKTAEIYNV